MLDSDALHVQNRRPWATRGDQKITRIFFLEGKGALLPSAPAWCMYMTALRISWPSSVLEERCIGSVWFFSLASVIVFVDFSMADLKEQCVCIRFCFLLGKTATEIVTMLWETFKEEALSQARVYEWFSRFKRGDMSLENQPRSGRPSTSGNDENIQKICNAIMSDRRWTIDELETLTGVSWSSCQRILTEELHMKWVAAKFVPSLLSECIECAEVSHKKWDYNGFAPPVLPGPDTLRFFPVSRNEEGP